MNGHAHSPNKASQGQLVSPSIQSGVWQLFLPFADAQSTNLQDTAAQSRPLSVQRARGRVDLGLSDLIKRREISILCRGKGGGAGRVRIVAMELERDLQVCRLTRVGAYRGGRN